VTIKDDIFVPADALAKIAASNELHGKLVLRYVTSDEIFVVHGVETSRGMRRQVDIPREYHALRAGNGSYDGRWIESPSSALHVVHAELRRRPGSMMTPADFKELSGVRLDAGMKTLIVITHDAGLSEDLRAGGVETYAGWHLTRDGARPASIAVEPATHGLKQLEGLWPLSELSAMNIAVVGCGSIGSAAAEALAGYGVGSLQLIDPDRLLWHNLVRHSLDRRSVGRSKAAALADSLTQRWQRESYFAHDVDVVREAGVLRALTSDADLVLCAADGVAPRRVVSHVARRAKIPAILACVLDGGAIGEILRLRPTPRFGCLLCLRANMQERGAIDAEADQELDYGAGTAHLPMTAAPSDLKYIGALAAKAAVATLLESRFGDATQRLPSEHAVIGLRPAGDLHAPFDLNHAADVVWRSIPAPRPECVTCNP